MDYDNQNLGSLEDRKECCSAHQWCIENSNHAEWYMSYDASGKVIQLDGNRRLEWTLKNRTQIGGVNQSHKNGPQGFEEVIEELDANKLKDMMTTEVKVKQGAIGNSRVTMTSLSHHVYNGKKWVEEKRETQPLFAGISHYIHDGKR